MTSCQNEDEEGPDENEAGSVAIKATDAAVRHALIESRQDLLNFLCRRLGHRADAEDVLQRFSLRALERASELRDIRTVRGWLGRILATSIIDHQRRAMRTRRREVPMDQTDLEKHTVEPDTELDGVICNCLYKLLPTLKAEYADVVWRADILGEPRDRIAASLGVTLNNVTVRIHRGRHALKERLEEMCLTCPVHGFLECRCMRIPTKPPRRSEMMSPGVPR